MLQVRLTKAITRSVIWTRSSASRFKRVSSFKKSIGPFRSLFLITQTSGQFLNWPEVCAEHTKFAILLLHLLISRANNLPIILAFLLLQMPACDIIGKVCSVTRVTVYYTSRMLVKDIFCYCMEWFMFYTFLDFKRFQQQRL